MGIYENPKNVFVAGFIGSPSMNLLVTKVIEENGRLSVDGGSFRLAIPENLQRRYIELGLTMKSYSGSGLSISTTVH